MMLLLPHRLQFYCICINGMKRKHEAETQYVTPNASHIPHQTKKTISKNPLLKYATEILSSQHLHQDLQLLLSLLGISMLYIYTRNSNKIRAIMDTVWDSYNVHGTIQSLKRLFALSLQVVSHLHGRYASRHPKCPSRARNGFNFSIVRINKQSSTLVKAPFRRTGLIVFL